MQVRTGLFCALFLLLCASATAAPNLADLAPADQYFGRMRMSILGITNAIRDAGSHLDRGDNPEAIITGLAWTEDAIRDWEHRFPRDPWIARSLTNLRTLYGRISSARGTESLRRISDWLDRDYPPPPAALSVK